MRRVRGHETMIAILGVMVLLMALFPARVLECDAVIYACAGIHGDVVQSTDAGHLAWGGFEVLAAAIGRAFAPPLNPLFILRWLSVGSALLGAWLVYRLLAGRLRVPATTAALFAGSLLASYSYLHFGLQGEPHALHTLALVVFLCLSAGFLAHPTRRGAALTACALAVATLLHQTSILLAPAVMAGIVVAMRAPGARRGDRMPLLVLFTVVYGLAVVVPYLAVGWFVRELRTIAGYRSWIMGISEWGGWGNWRWTSPIAGIVGIVRSWTGSHYLLGIGPVREFAARLFPSASWDDELLVAGAVPGLVRLVLLPLHAAVACGTAWLLARAAREVRAAWRPAPALGTMVALWLVIHTVFFTWWAPERAEFWIAFWVPMVVLVAPAVVRRPLRVPLLACGVAALAIVNLAGSIIPQSSPRLEPATLAAVAIDPAVKAGDVLLTDLPLGTRAGRFVYALDIVAVPNGAEHAQAVVDSLRAAVVARGNRLYWVSRGNEPPHGLAAQIGDGAVVPVRAAVVVQAFH